MLRANDYKNIAIQFNGLAKIVPNWLYFIPGNGNIFMMPISTEVEKCVSRSIVKV